MFLLKHGEPIFKWKLSRQDAAHKAEDPESTG
jgi:hypothetical protein